jgi:hypothetical protein
MNEIEIKFGKNKPNRINLQRFWSVNRDMRDPWTEWIRECFGLGEDSSRISLPPVVEPSQPVIQDLPQTKADTFSYLDVWATGGTAIIPEPVARFLRTTLYELVTGQLHDLFGISISKPLFQVGQLGEFLQRDSFLIAQAGGGGAVGKHSKFWTIEIDVSISTALIFKQILQSSSTGRQMSPSQVSDIYKFIEPMVMSAKIEYDQRFGQLSEQVTELKFFAEIFGNSDELLDDLLSDQLELNKKTRGRNPQWVALIERWTEKRTESLQKLLAVAGAAKGDGGTLSTRVSALLSQQTSNNYMLPDNELTTANDELIADNKKLNEIIQFFGGREATELFAELRDSITEIDMHLAGQLIPQPQLFDLRRQLDEIDSNWDSDLLNPKDLTGLTSEEIVKTVAETDTMLIDTFLNGLTEILRAVDAIVSRANVLGNGNSTSNSTLIEIQNSLQDAQQTLEQLK